MSAVADPSPWDSDVFGCRVGLLREGSPVPETAIVENNAETFDVVFVRFHGWVDQKNSAPGLDYLYDMELRAFEGSAIFKRTVRSGITVTDPGQNHLEIARTAFLDSRFIRDRRLAEKAPEMYARWVAGGKVHVIDEFSDDAFLVKTGDVDGTRRISLVAVDRDFRGQGIGEFLIRGSIQNDPGTWRVRVAVRNCGAIRLYEKIGFRVKSIWTVFHVWMEDYRRL